MLGGILPLTYQKQHVGSQKTGQVDMLTLYRASRAELT